MNWEELLPAVTNLAKEAGLIILGHKDCSIIVKEGNANFATMTDIAISKKLSEALPKLLPGSKMISEESSENADYQSGYVWIIDPIDGTNNFIFDLRFSVVSIGLFVDGKPTLGVVYNPYADEMYMGIRGKGAFVNGVPMHVADHACIADTIVLLETGSYDDRSLMTTFTPLRAVFTDCVDYRVLGSAALDICYVASGKVSAFFAQKISLWDYAAALVFLEEAGGCATQWNSAPLDHAKSGSILVTNGRLHEEMLKRLAFVG